MLVCTVLCCAFGFAACDLFGTPDEGNGEQEKIHVHSFSEWIVAVEPTYTEAGSKESVCACGEKQSEVIPAHFLTEAFSDLRGGNTVYLLIRAVEGGVILITAGVCGVMNFFAVFN